MSMRKLHAKEVAQANGDSPGTDDPPDLPRPSPSTEDEERTEEQGEKGRRELEHRSELERKAREEEDGKQRKARADRDEMQKKGMDEQEEKERESREEQEVKQRKTRDEEEEKHRKTREEQAGKQLTTREEQQEKQRNTREEQNEKAQQRRDEEQRLKSGGRAGEPGGAEELDDCSSDAVQRRHASLSMAGIVMVSLESMVSAVETDLQAKWSDMVKATHLLRDDMDAVEKAVEIAGAVKTQACALLKPIPGVPEVQSPVCSTANEMRFMATTSGSSRGKRNGRRGPQDAAPSIIPVPAAPTAEEGVAWIARERELLAALAKLQCSAAEASAAAGRADCLFRIYQRSSMISVHEFNDMHFDALRMVNAAIGVELPAPYRVFHALGYELDGVMSEATFKSSALFLEVTDGGGDPQPNRPTPTDDSTGGNGGGTSGGPTANDGGTSLTPPDSAGGSTGGTGPTAAPTRTIMEGSESVDIPLPSFSVPFPDEDLVAAARFLRALLSGIKAGDATLLPATLRPCEAPADCATEAGLASTVVSYFGDGGIISTDGLWKLSDAAVHAAVKLAAKAEVAKPMVAKPILDTLLSPPRLLYLLVTVPTVGATVGPKDLQRVLLAKLPPTDPKAAVPDDFLQQLNGRFDDDHTLGADEANWAGELQTTNFANMTNSEASLLLANVRGMLRNWLSRACPGIRDGAAADCSSADAQAGLTFSRFCAKDPACDCNADSCRLRGAGLKALAQATVGFVMDRWLTKPDHKADLDSMTSRKLGELFGVKEGAILEVTEDAWKKVLFSAALPLEDFTLDTYATFNTDAKDALASAIKLAMADEAMAIVADADKGKGSEDLAGGPSTAVAASYDTSNAADVEGTNAEAAPAEEAETRAKVAYDLWTKYFSVSDQLGTDAVLWRSARPLVRTALAQELGKEEWVQVLSREGLQALLQSSAVTLKAWTSTFFAEPLPTPQTEVQGDEEGRIEVAVRRATEAIRSKRHWDPSGETKGSAAAEYHKLLSDLLDPQPPQNDPPSPNEPTGPAIVQARRESPELGDLREQIRQLGAVLSSLKSQLPIERMLDPRRAVAYAQQLAADLQGLERAASGEEGTPQPENGSLRIRMAVAFAEQGQELQTIAPTLLKADATKSSNLATLVIGTAALADRLEERANRLENVINKVQSALATTLAADKRCESGKDGDGGKDLPITWQLEEARSELAEYQGTLKQAREDKDAGVDVIRQFIDRGGPLPESLKEPMEVHLDRAPAPSQSAGPPSTGGRASAGAAAGDDEDRSILP